MHQRYPRHPRYLAASFLNNSNSFLTFSDAAFRRSSVKIVLKSTAMQIEKALINHQLRVSKVS